MQRFGVDLRCDQFRSKDGFDLGTKDERLGSERVIQRLDTDVIANQRQRSLAIIPNGEGKHAVETADSFLAPLSEHSQQDFGVTICFEPVSARSKLFAQFAVVINLAVESENVTAVRRKHWLVAGGSRINDRETAMAEAGAPAGIINRVRNPHAMVVATAVLDTFEHRSNACLRVAAYDSSNTTHLDLRESRMRNVARVVAANSSRLIGAGTPWRKQAQIR